MKRIIASIIFAASLAGAAGLAPDQFTFTWTRQGTTGLANTNTWLSGVTYLLTNCAAMQGTNAIDLTGCGVIIRVGDSTTNVAYNGVVQSPATGGLFYCTFQIPATVATTAATSIILVNGATPGAVTPKTYLTNIQLTITNATITAIDKEQKQLTYAVPLR